MNRITYKSAAEIEKMRDAGRVVSTALARMRDAVEPGVSTAALDSIARDVITCAGGSPSFLGYNGFPASICSSLNEEIVHGIPSEKVVLKEGDLVKLDVGVKLKGFHADSAISVPVGEVDPLVLRLSEATRSALWRAIRSIRAKARLQVIGKAVQEHVEAEGFVVVRDLVGHGIGRKLHEAPQIPNYVDDRHPNPVLIEGMTLAIEPMVNAGAATTRTLSDGWTVVTSDGLPSAHWEHTVVVTRHGVEVLTLGPHDAGERLEETG